jgi:hypothetical protein
MAELETKDANDRIFNVLWGAGALDGAFLCECARAHCIEEVPMALAEYVRLRDRGEVLFARDHEGSNADPRRPFSLDVEAGKLGPQSLG